MQRQGLSESNTAPRRWSRLHLWPTSGALPQHPRGNPGPARSHPLNRMVVFVMATLLAASGCAGAANAPTAALELTVTPRPTNTPVPASTSPPPTPTQTQRLAPTNTLSHAEVLSPTNTSPVPTPLETPPVASPPSDGAVMVFVPAGEFEIGSLSPVGTYSPPRLSGYGTAPIMTGGRGQ